MRPSMATRFKELDYYSAIYWRFCKQSIEIRLGCRRTIWWCFETRSNFVPNRPSDLHSETLKDFPCWCSRSNLGVALVPTRRPALQLPLPQSDHVQSKLPRLRLVVQRQVRGFGQPLRHQRRPLQGRLGQSAVEPDAPSGQKEKRRARAI